jgi:hypothetical protein
VIFLRGAGHGAMKTGTVITFDSVDLIFSLNQPFVLYRMVL